MRIISFIEQPDVIQNILEHLGLWEESHAPPDRGRAAIPGPVINVRQPGWRNVAIGNRLRFLQEFRTEWQR
jgi:hypothetical protein